MAKQSISKIQEDFEIFGKGVKRLEELKSELSQLNTYGYEEDVAKIKPLLNKVSSVPRIELLVEELRSKIAKGKKSSKSKSNKKSSKTKSTKKSLRKTKSKSKLKSKPKKEKKYRNAKHVINAKGHELENEIDIKLSSVRHDLKERLFSTLNAEKEILSRKLHEDLMRREAQMKEREVKLRERYEKEYQNKLKQELKKRVNKEFHSKVNKKYEQIRKQLSEEFDFRQKIEEQKFGDEMQKVLSMEKNIVRDQSKKSLSEKSQSLHKRHHIKQIELREKYNLKVNELSNKYQKALNDAKNQLESAYSEKVKKELGRKVSFEFNKMLSKKLKSRLDKERRELQKRLDNEYNKHLRELKSLSNKELAKHKTLQKNRLEEEYNASKQEYLSKLSEHYSEYEEELHTSYENTLASELSRVYSQVSKKEKELEKLKLDLNKEYTKKLGDALHRKVSREFNSRLREKLNVEEKKLITKYNQITNNEKNKLESHYMNKLKDDIDIEKRKVNEDLKREFNNKLNKENKLIESKFNKELVSVKKEYCLMKLDLKKNYEDKIKNSLKRKVDSEFASKLKNSLERERIKLETAINKRLSKREDALRRRYNSRLQGAEKLLKERLTRQTDDLNKKSQMQLNREYKHNLQNSRTKLGREYDHKVKFIENKYNNKLNNELSKIKRELSRKHNEELAKEKFQLNKKHNYSESRLNNIILQKRKQLDLEQKQLEDAIKQTKNSKQSMLIDGEIQEQQLASNIAELEDYLKKQTEESIQKNKEMSEKLSSEEYKKSSKKLSEEMNKITQMKKDLKNKQFSLQDTKWMFEKKAEQEKKQLENHYLIHEQELASHISDLENSLKLNEQQRINNEMKKIAQMKKDLGSKKSTLEVLRINLKKQSEHEKDDLEDNYAVREQQLVSYISDLEDQLKKETKQNLNKEHQRSAKIIREEKNKLAKLGDELNKAKNNFVKKQCQLQSEITDLRVERERLHSEHLKSLQRDKVRLQESYKAKEKELGEKLEKELKHLRKKILDQSTLELDQEIALREQLAYNLRTELKV